MTFIRGEPKAVRHKRQPAKPYSYIDVTAYCMIVM